eukprot:SAG11_NODE_33234_length_278_cov_0.910615_1_plen_25_part_10
MAGMRGLMKGLREIVGPVVPPTHRE